MLDDALHALEYFKGASLKKTISQIETRLAGIRADEASTLNSEFEITASLINAAAEVKRASAQIDVVIHTLGILYSLPHILDAGEIVESTSLGAGNAGSEFDLITDRRIAEFKFIFWQGGSEAIRKKSFFEDYYKLVREHTPKRKFFYLLNTEIPLAFLGGNRSMLKVLDRNRRLCDDFEKRYGAQQYPTVGAFYRAHEGQVTFVNLLGIIPELAVLVGKYDESL